MSKQRDAYLIKTYATNSKSLVNFSIIVILVFLGMFAEYFLTIANSIPERDKLTIYFSFFIATLGFLYLLRIAYIYRFSTFLKIYEDGLELQKGTASLFSEWKNLDRFGKQGSGSIASYGIHFYEKRKTKFTNIFDLASLPASSSFLPLQNFVEIPLENKGFWEGLNVDVDKMLETDFGKQIYELAPHVFFDDELD